MSPCGSFEQAAPNTWEAVVTPSLAAADVVGAAAELEVLLVVELLPQAATESANAAMAVSAPSRLVIFTSGSSSRGPVGPNLTAGLSTVVG
jgi:predicted short-subunit dehydrogenase-like oxidoreductase (DUF2520 family)